MRYPTMTRVFAVFLALCCLMLIGAGAFGIYKSLDEKQEKTELLKNVRQNAGEYMELNKRLAGGVSYKDEKAELEEKTEKFDEESSDHRREITEYTATKSGLKIGTEALDQADAAFKAGKEEYLRGLKEFEAKEAEFNAGYEKFLEGKKQLAAGRAVFDETVKTVEAAKQALNGVESLDALYESNDPAERRELCIKACDETIAAMDSASASVKNLEEKGIITAQQAEKIREAVKAACGMSFEELRAKIANARDEVLNGDSQGMSEEAYIKFKLEYSRYIVLIHIGAESAKTGIEKTEPELQKKNQELAAAEEELKKAEPMMEEGKKGIDQGRKMLQEAGKEIDAAERQLYSSRTMIWYELGKLEEQFKELELQKAKLSGDSEAIKKLEAEAEERKELENRRTSLSLKLRQEQRIRELYEADTEVYDAAQIYASELENETERQYKLQSIGEGLMILTGILGICPMFSVFGKEKYRWKRLSLPSAVLILSGICLLYGFAAGFGLLKSCLVVLFADAAVVLSAFPNKKKKEILIEE